MFWVIFLYYLFSDAPFYSYICILKACKKKDPTKHRDILSKLRQALVAIISYAPIRSVRTFFWWKLTAITALQIGHLIFIMPSTASGSASNNLLFLQHGQATCTSCIHFSPPGKRPAKRDVKLTVDNIPQSFLCTVP